MTSFDTVNHEILLNRLEHRYGMAGSVPAWMRSYLTDRSLCVYLQGGASSKTGVACGVPQGSALGPMLFSAYTAPIGDIIRRYNLGFHLYADNTQLYITFEMTEINRLLSLRRIEQCLNDVRAWMGDNQLKLKIPRGQQKLLLKALQPRQATEAEQTTDQTAEVTEATTAAMATCEDCATAPTRDQAAGAGQNQLASETERDVYTQLMSEHVRTMQGATATTPIPQLVAGRGHTRAATVTA
ncbi:hypothetical protein NP493_3036g00000 [Ridgeia piscesae]|uniref:Reverse transcriptase domain-containing protein n=1 Tax=Ridgeia piscesae TaxID=27915 RepID=A0AAD9J9Y5_RIDPI|nr:hypothetical protein NP493_3036g00000 [Ridgeia piscesae]